MLVAEHNRKWWISTTGEIIVIVAFFWLIGDADFRKPVTEGVARETQQTRSLALVSIGATKSLANHLVFPLLERHTLGKKTNGRISRLSPLRINVNIRGFQHWSGSQRRGTLHDILQLANISRPVVVHKDPHGCW